MNTSEHGLSRAVDAAARQRYEAIRTTAESKGILLLPWEDLPPFDKFKVRESVTPVVVAALDAFPDPRHVAWEEGLRASFVDVEATNPYPLEV